MADADVNGPHDDELKPPELRDDWGLQQRLMTRIRRKQRLLEKVAALAEKRVLTRRYRDALTMARKLYRAGVGTTECAERTGLSRRVVHNHTRDIYHQRVAEARINNDNHKGG
jgi:DNA-binding transcriptional regulator LsrR (DeoR family)